MIGRLEARQQGLATRVLMVENRSGEALVEQSLGKAV